MFVTRWTSRLAGLLPFARLFDPLRSLPRAEANVPMQWVELAPIVGLPPGFGIFIDPSDPLIGRSIHTHRLYEQHIVIAIRSVLKPGQVFLDIGANVGFHTLVAAQAAGAGGKVLAVEMSPVNCTLLRASLARNGVTNVTIFPCAVAERAGWMSFCVTPKSGNGMLVNDYLRQRIETEPEHYSPAVPVRALPVDRLLRRRQPVHVVKMDIEGSELRALKGMSRLLSRQRPYILFEFHPNLLRDIGGAPPTDLLDALRGYGYRIRRVLPGGAFGDQELGNEDAMRAALRPDGQYDLLDLIAIPPGGRA